MQHYCVLHKKQQLTAYCQTCKDPVCIQCTHLGPHADQRHRILDLQQASRIRQLFYLAYRDKQVLPALERVYNYLTQLEHKKQEVESERRVIEKDIALQFEGVRGRVEQVVNRQVIKKQTEVKQYQEVVNVLEDLVYSFDQVVQFPQRFLLCYRELNKRIRGLENRTLMIHGESGIGALGENSIIGQNSVNNVEKNAGSSQNPMAALMGNLPNNNNNSTPNTQQNPLQGINLNPLKTLDLNSMLTSWHIQLPQPDNILIPRQMPLSFARANQLPLFKSKNQFLNKIISKSVEHYHAELTRARQEVVMNQKRILHIFNHYNMKLLSMKSAKVCGYCLAAFSISQANQPCAYNKSYKSELNCGYMEEMARVPVEIRGQKMHYWTNAKVKQQPIPDVNAHFLIRNVQKKQFKNSLMGVSAVKCYLKCYDINVGRDRAYLDEFYQVDREKKGVVTELAFMFVMTNRFEVAEQDARVVMGLCRGGKKEEGNSFVEYGKMVQVLDDPLSLLRKFEQEQQQIEKAKPQAPPSFRYKY